MIKRLWNFVWSPTGRFSLGGLIIFGMVLGIILWGGFNWGMQLSNKEQFCISCHEMRDNVYAEMKTRIHFSNQFGVTASCSDCHEPHNWFALVWRKMKASKELYHKILGTIDTREKFEAHRLELAEEVWATLKASDSAECRYCHKVDRMDFSKQSRRARVQHETMKENGQTCIDCHKGIAHDKPKEPEKEQPQDQNLDFTL